MDDPPKKNNLNSHWKNLDVIFQDQARKYVLEDDKEKFNTFCTELGFNDIQKEFLFESIKTFGDKFKSPYHPHTQPHIYPYPPFLRTSQIPPPYRYSQSPSCSVQKLPITITDSTHSTPSPPENNKNKNKNHNRNRHKSPSKSVSEPNVLINIESITNGSTNKCLYAIPNNKNERISGNKRKRSDVESDFDHDLDDDDDDDSPKKKKRKTNKKNKKKHKNSEDDDIEILWNKDDGNKVIDNKQQEKLEEEGIYIVEEILGHKKTGKKYKYNVSWQGYDDKTWEPAENVNPYMLEMYWKEVGFKTDKQGAIQYLKALKLDVANDGDVVPRSFMESPKSKTKKKTKTKTKSKTKAKKIKTPKSAKKTKSSKSPKSRNSPSKNKNKNKNKKKKKKRIKNGNKDDDDDEDKDVYWESDSGHSADDQEMISVEE